MCPGPPAALLVIALLEDLERAVEGAVAYLLVVGVVALDAVVPVVPGETVAVTAAVLASQGRLELWAVVAATWFGAFVGDNLAYLLGRGLGRRLARRLVERKGRTRALVAWSRHQIKRRGPTLIVAARFVPGGRTAVTFASGSLEMRWRRFALADALAAAIWTCYVVALGYIGGRAFAETLWKPLLVALAVAAGVSGIAEVLRRLGTDDDEAGVHEEEREVERLVDEDRARRG